MSSASVELRKVPALATGVPSTRPEVSSEERQGRLAELQRRAETEFVVVYGDREHAANLQFLTGYDPRFEEAVLVLGPAGCRVLIVGVEGQEYAEATTPWIDLMVCGSLSLLDQPRAHRPRLVECLQDSGVRRGASVGIVGWKYLTAAETDTPEEPAFVPAALVSALRHVSQTPPVDMTRLMMAAEDGQRARNSATQIAAFEWGASRASAAMNRIVAHARPGLSELETAAQMGYAGETLNCHVMLSADPGSVVGLRSPSARLIAEGDAVTGAVGYPGGLCSRAGIMAKTLQADMFEHVVRPYFRAVAGWYGTIASGVAGGEINEAVRQALAESSLAPALNPGHLGSYDEWVSSPVVAGSDRAIHSGALLQCDIIPTPLPKGCALNCEDTVAIADASLRDELRRDHPEMWSRIEKRRAYIHDELGLELDDSVLPLSDSVARLAPCWMDSDRVCVATA